MKTKEHFERIIREAQEGLEKLECPFKKVDWVEVRDRDGRPWQPRRFGKFDTTENTDYPYQDKDEEWWKECRQPQTTNILIRHTGDEMPEWIRDKRVTVFFGEKAERKKASDYWNWTQSCECPITHFLVHEE